MRKVPMRRIAAVALLWACAAQADTLKIRRGGQEREERGVTVVSDGEEEVVFSKGAVQDKVQAGDVVSIQYEGLPPEYEAARAKEREGAFGEAGELYTKAAEKASRAPLKVLALFAAGEAYLSQGRFDSARQAFGQCAAVGARARLGLLAPLRSAQCDFYEGKLDGARATLEAIRVPGALPPLREVERRYWQGRILAAKGDPGAKAQFEEAARGTRDRFPEIFERSQVRLAWLSKSPAVEELWKAREELATQGAQAECLALLSEAYLKAAEAVPAGKKEERLELFVQAAFHALHVTTTLEAYPEPLALAYDVAVKALAALQDKHAAELEKARAARFGGTGWVGRR